MKNRIIISGLSIILLITVCLSGCQEENNNNIGKTNGNVIFISEDLQILELVNSSLEIIEDDNNEITNIRVLFRFRNLLDKIIRNLTLDISYYDKNDVLLGNSTYTYVSIPPNWIEADPSRPGVFSSDGVENFDHVKLSIIDYVIVK